MARKVSASFQGVSIADVDADAPSFRRAIEDSVGDEAYVFDALTGENGVDTSKIINHTGNVRGCPLGVPLVNQYFGRQLTLSTPSTKDTHGGTGELVLAPYILPLPAVETGFMVVVVMTDFNERLLDEDTGQGKVRVFDTTMTQVAEVPLVFIDFDGFFMAQALVEGLTPNARYVLFPILRTDSPNLTSGATVDLGKLQSVTVHYLREGSVSAPSRNSANNFGVWTPAATEGLAHRDFHTSVLANLEAIAGDITAGLNRNLNSDEEYTDAWPAGGNLSYTHVDHDGSGNPDAVNPARSRFHAHTRSLYANEGEVPFAVFAASLGTLLYLPSDNTAKFSVELVEPPVDGLTTFYAPWMKTVDVTELMKLHGVLPDFPAGASSKLKMAVFIISDASANVDQWTVACKTGAGSSAGATPAAMDASDTWWLATDTAIDFTPDDAQEMTLLVERAGSLGPIGEAAFAAFCLYFDP